ncbi:acetyltransferase [Glycomyces sp. L485]|uniref:GNAT family N-acetyltransferase n=1 Tax=Glycomyces sp. L485 TaxID=2909235 RepID=UPI001F4B6171|nr:GNAT family N-acetyltransferase [Glycomyces sp. L485]MCH7231181.1 acetyltransferase [Glycomyces sp. L485]
MIEAPTMFKRQDDRLGEYSLRHVDPAADAPLLHEWVTHPKCRYWMMSEASIADVWAKHESIAASDHHFAYLGLHQYRAKFLVEVYDPARTELADACDVAEGDLGVHVLTAPTSTPIPGFTERVMVTVMELLFTGFDAKRVVVEPDATNEPVHRLNDWVGFRAERTVELRDKQALLSFCTPSDYERSAARGVRR